MKYNIYITIENGIATSEALSAGQLIEKLSGAINNPESLSDEELSSFNVVRIETPEYPVNDYMYKLDLPSLVDGVWSINWVQQDSQERLDNKRILSRTIREGRDILLSKSDWTQMPDVTLTDDKKSAWLAYRQDLRDLTNQPNFPWEFNWPIKPQ